MKLLVFGIIDYVIFIWDFPGKVNVRTKLKLKSFVEKFYSSNTNSSRRRVTLKRKKILDLLMQLSPQNINLKYFLLWRRH